MPASSLTVLRRHCACLSTLQLADKYLERAQQLIATQKRENAEAALVPLDAALEIHPDWEKALELKARALLYLKRFKEVVEMLHDFVPSMQQQQMMAPLTDSSSSSPSSSRESSMSKERTRLLSDHLPAQKQCSNTAKLKHKLSFASCKKKASFERQHWRYLVLGQACCYLGMMEDAVVLLQCGKRSASVMSRRKSNCMRDDNFCAESITPAESDLVNNMLANIKFLLRRRAAAMAALEAGLYAESARHFSKIIDAKKGTPHGFIADCYLHRAIAHQAMGKVVDAISDCNKNLSLNPKCARALSVRASMYEMVKCFSECLLDLQQLKMIYEAALRYQLVPDQSRWAIWHHNSTCDADLARGLDQINSKIAAMRQKLTISCCLESHAILDMPLGCTMEDVEKAFLLISLKHRPEKAAEFLDHCDYMDGRDIDIVKEEARASASRLAHLILKAYTQLLSSISDDLAKRKKTCKKQGAIKKTLSKKGGENSLPTINEEEEEEKRGAAAIEGAGPLLCNSITAENPLLVADKDEAFENAAHLGEKWKWKDIEESMMIMAEGKSSPCSDAPEELMITCSEPCNNLVDEEKGKLVASEEVLIDAFTGYNLDVDESNAKEDVMSTTSSASSHSPRMEAQAAGELDQFMNMMICNNNSNNPGGLSSTILANALSQALFHDNLLSRKASTWIHTPEWNLPLTPLPVT